MTKRLLSSLLLLVVGVSTALAATLTLTPSQCTYSSSGNYTNLATFSSTPVITVTASANNMDKRQTSSYLLWHTGSARSGSYSISIASGYIITGYTITGYVTSGNNHTLTPTGGSATTISATSAATAQTMTVTGLNASATSFTMAGNNTGLRITQITVDYIESAVSFSASDVVTLMNSKQSNRGGLTYEPGQANVWSSYKGTALDNSNPNHQWVLYPTGADGEYYLYNVGADKFAVPTATAQSAQNAWTFSDNAVAITLMEQSDGTFRIKMATNPVNGTNQAVIGINKDLAIPVFNYEDTGSDFTISKISGADASAAASAAVARLVKSQTALTTAPTTSGWYVIKNRNQIENRYIYPSASDINYNGTPYALTYTGSVAVEPNISDPAYYTYIDVDNQYWQLPEGRYLAANSSGKFPTRTNEPTPITAFGYDGGSYIKGTSSMYAVPYNLSSTMFVGESSTYKTFYLYPINLTTAGLVDWKVIVTNGTSQVYEQLVSCSRSDVVGLTEVYTGGHFFFPTGVTPTETDFSMSGSQGITVDASAHTVTVQFDPNLAIVESAVTVAQGFQTAGRSEGVMLLRVTAEPFKDATNATISVNLKDGTENNISALTLYEASSVSPEVLTIFNTDDTTNKMSSAPTLTSLNTVAVSGSTATLSIGNLTAGTHYYWIAATVNSDAALGSVLDAAVTGITYTCNSNETTLDLTSKGDPADRGAMVFNTRSYPFLPSTYNSRVYRIPAMVVADDGSIVVAADKRYASHTDIGNGHVIDIVIRRSTDGGRTWSAPVTIAKGLGSSDNNKCGYGDPSLVKGKNGKLYCLFAAGNLGYFYGQKHICMSTSTDNGVTWSSNETTAPVDLYSTGAIQNVSPTPGSAGGYGLYDYFVTSGKGLYTSDGILMYLIPAQTLTSSNYSTLTDGTYWGAASDDYIFYSLDDGDTWYFSTTPMITGGDEAKIIEMNDGSLFGSIRKSAARRFNTGTYTKNGSTLDFEFGTQWDNSQLYQSSQNNQDIVYYQRGPKSGKTDIIFHSITTGNHVNFKLFYSLDEGRNWTEFLNVQTKGTRYVTMERGGTDENPGSLYMLFEDQSLNGDGGGYTDYNHYPLNFIEITREQLEALIPVLNDPYQDNPTEEVKVVYGNTSHNSYGSLSGNVWTSNETSGMAGVTMTKSDGNFNQFTSWNSHFNLAYAPGANNVASTLTLAAPAGYAITGYNLLAAKAYSATHTYTLEGEDGTTITPAFASSATGYTTMSVTGLATPSTQISITSTDVSKYLAIADFTISLRRAVTYNMVGTDGNVTASQFVVFETNDVADEMPDALKVSGIEYEFFSDAACTAKVTAIDDLQNVYVRPAKDFVDATVQLAQFALSGTGVGYPAEDHASRVALEAISNISTPVSDPSYDYTAFSADDLAAIATHTVNMLVESDPTKLAMPEEGHAYSFKLVLKDGSTPKYLRYGTLNSDRTGATSGIELANIPTSGDVPEDGWFIGKKLSDGRYVFVNVAGKFVCYANSSGQGVYQNGVSETYAENGYLDIVKFPFSGSSLITNTEPTDAYGKVFIRGYRTSGGSSNSGTIIVKEDGLVFDKSADPYYNGSFTSMFAVQEHKFINQDVAPRDGGEAFYTTLYLPFAVELPAGATAYTGKINTETNMVDMTEIAAESGVETTVLPKNTPVLLKFASQPEGGSYTFVPALTAGVSIESGTNDLLGSLVTIAAPANTYTFQKLNGRIGFYRYSGTNVYEGKAYLVFNNGGAMNSFALNFDGTATGINALETTAENAKFYDLSGRRVAMPQKGGVYIVNGKKVMVK